MKKENKDVWHNYRDVVKGMPAEVEAAVMVFIDYMLEKLKHPEKINKYTIEVSLETTEMGLVEYTVSAKTNQNFYYLTISSEGIKNKMFELEQIKKTENNMEILKEVVLEFDFDEYNDMIKNLREQEYYGEGYNPGLAQGCMDIFQDAQVGAAGHEWKLLKIEEQNNRFFIFTMMPEEEAKRWKQ